MPRFHFCQCVGTIFPLFASARIGQEKKMFCAFICIILLSFIPGFCLASRLPVAASAAKPTMHAASEPAPETAVHTSAEAGLAAEGVLVCHAAVVESAECAGVAAPLYVRRSEATIGSMVEVASEIVATSEIVAMVEKGMAP
jgi:hypothetical protein